MNRFEFLDIMREINAAYGDKNFPLSDEKMNTWYKYLQGCEYEMFMEALADYIKSNAFPPTISDLYQIYGNLQKTMPVAEEEEEEELVGDDW